MAQVFSFAGLILVPLGIIWLWFVLMERKPGSGSGKYTTGFGYVSLLVLGLIAFVVSFGAFSNYNLSFGIIFLMVCFIVLAKAILKLRKDQFPGHSKFNPAPVYLIIIPAMVFFARLLFITPAVEFSRYYAIRKSEPLINAIEAHQIKFGHYPVSLQALHMDFSPGMIGIPQYHYEINGNAYNLFFKQPSDELPVEEIVMYNKSDEHAYAAHALDILEYSGEELELRRGDRHRYKLAVPHWIYIKLD